MIGSFSRQSAYRGCQLTRRLAVLSAIATYQLLTRTSSFDLQRAIPSARARVTPASLPLSYVRYRNINRLSIVYACRLRLRPRLTLIRLTLFRKPWVFGVRVSRPHYRYLCLHLLFQPLQHTSQCTFSADWNAPLPLSRVHSFGSGLDARLSSMQRRSTSELLRTL